jgi:hypothetical protein
MHLLFLFLLQSNRTSDVPETLCFNSAGRNLNYTDFGAADSCVAALVVVCNSITVNSTVYCCNTLHKAFSHTSVRCLHQHDICVFSTWRSFESLYHSGHLATNESINNELTELLCWEVQHSNILRVTARCGSKERSNWDDVENSLRNV